jgi:hypothetical protein
MSPRKIIAGMMILTVVFGFAVQVSIFGASVSSRNKVFGTVYASSGVPVSGAFVTAQDSGGYGYATTDATGQYLISQGLNSGNYTVTAMRVGYVNAEIANVTVTAGSTTPGIGLYMNLSGGIYGRVTDSVSSMGIPNLSVLATLYSGSGTYFGGGLTNSFGDYQIDMNLGAGTYNVTIFMPKGYIGKSTGPVPVTAGSRTTGIDLALDRSGVISGRVTTLGDQPLANVTVSAIGTSPTDFGFDQTNATGYYRIASGLGTDTYMVAASGHGGYNFTSDVSVTAGQQTPNVDITLSVAASGIIIGTVTDTSSKPIANAEVSAIGGTTFSYGTAFTDTNGNYMISNGLESDTYTVTASAVGYQTQNLTGVNVVSGQTTQLAAIQLPAIPASQSGKISGTVTGDANPIPEFQYPLAMMMVMTLICVAVAKLSSCKIKYVRSGHSKDTG